MQMSFDGKLTQKSDELYLLAWMRVKTTLKSLAFASFLVKASWMRELQ